MPLWCECVGRKQKEYHDIGFTDSDRSSPAGALSLSLSHSLLNNRFLCFSSLFLRETKKEQQNNYALFLEVSLQRKQKMFKNEKTKEINSKNLLHLVTSSFILSLSLSFSFLLLLLLLLLLLMLFAKRSIN